MLCGDGWCCVVLCLLCELCIFLYSVSLCVVLWLVVLCWIMSLYVVVWCACVCVCVMCVMRWRVVLWFGVLCLSCIV